MAKWKCVSLAYEAGPTIKIMEADERVCQIHGSDLPQDADLKWRRARLIAAAPDLLAALKGIMANGLNQKTFEEALQVIYEVDAGKASIP